MAASHSFDDLDARLLMALIAQPRATTLALAQMTGASRNTIQSRLNRMDENKVLRSVDHRVDPAALGYPLTAFATIIAKQSGLRRLTDDLAEIPEVLYVFELSGPIDLLVRFVARDTDDLHRIARQISDLPGVERTETSLTIQRTLDYRVTPLLRRALKR